MGDSLEQGQLTRQHIGQTGRQNKHENMWDGKILVCTCGRVTKIVDLSKTYNMDSIKIKINKYKYNS